MLAVSEMAARLSSKRIAREIVSCYRWRMSKTITATIAPKRKPGRPKNPNGRKRFWWLGCHCTYAEKLQAVATAEKELPGGRFSTWLRGRIGLPEKPGT